MMILITGGSKCGKSALGERLLSSWKLSIFYIATMIPYGEEAHEAIARHRAMRKNKGFVTVERYTDIGGLTLPVEKSEKKCAALLECMGNLCANEMFEAASPDPCGRILAGIRAFSRRVAHLIIITNQVGSDGIAYPEATMRYIENLGSLNAELAEMADCVIECVYGIPVPLKGGLPTCL